MANTDRQRTFVTDVNRKVKVTILRRDGGLVRTGEQSNNLADLMKWANVVYVLGSTDSKRGLVMDTLRDVSSKGNNAATLVEVRPANFERVLTQVGGAVRDTARRILFVAETWEDLYSSSAKHLGLVEYIFTSTPGYLEQLTLTDEVTIDDFRTHKKKIHTTLGGTELRVEVGTHVFLTDPSLGNNQLLTVARITSKTVYPDWIALLSAEGLHRVFPQRAAAFPEGTPLPEAAATIAKEMGEPWLTQPITALGLELVSNPLLLGRIGSPSPVEHAYLDVEMSVRDAPEYADLQWMEWNSGRLELPGRLYDELLSKDAERGSGGLRQHVWLTKCTTSMLERLSSSDIDPTNILLDRRRTADYLSTMNFQNMPFPRATGAPRTYEQLLRFGPCLAITRVDDEVLGDDDVDPVALSLAKANNRLLRYNPSLLDERFMDELMHGMDTNYPAYLWSIAYCTSIMQGSTDEEKTDWPGLTFAEARSGIPNPILMSTSPFGIQYERSSTISVVPLIQALEQYYPRGSVIGRASEIDFSLGVVYMVTEERVCPPIAWRINEPDSVGSGYVCVTSKVSDMHYIVNILDENVDPLLDYHLFLEIGTDLMVGTSRRHAISLITFIPGQRTFHVRINRKGSPPVAGKVAVQLPLNVYTIERSRRAGVEVTLCRRRDVSPSSFIFVPGSLTCAGFNHYATAVSIAVSSLGKGGPRRTIRQIVHKAIRAAEDIDLSGHLRLAAQLNTVTFTYYISVMLANLLGWRLDLVYKFDGQSSSDWHTIREYVETCETGLGDGVTALERANFTVCKNVLGRLEESEIVSKRSGLNPDAFTDFLSLIEELLGR